MINSIRAEFRKITTVRSTYINILIACLIAMFFAFYVFGFRTTGFVADPNKIRDAVYLILSSTTIFVGFIAILSFTHEYRYNMISYTLTSAKNRLNVLIAKTLVITGLAFAVTLLVGFLTVFSMYIGLAMSDGELVKQNLDIVELLSRSLFYSFGIGVLALVIGGLIRNQVGAIIVLLIGPNTVEALLTLALKAKAVYLPFTSLGQIMSPEGGVNFDGTAFPPLRNSVITVLVYIVVFWLLMAFLFKKRDAN